MKKRFLFCSVLLFVSGGVFFFTAFLMVVPSEDRTTILNYITLYQPQKYSFGSTNPQGVVKSMIMTKLDKGRLRTLKEATGGIDARVAYRFANRESIDETLRVVEVSTAGDYGIVFYRYSIGTGIFHDFTWVGKVEGKWYPIQVSSFNYLDAKPEDQDWYEKMKDKKQQWTDESDTSKFGSTPF